MPNSDSFPQIDPGYEIVRELGSGGFGSVYLAIQKELNRKVAIKVLHSVNIIDSSSRERFQREAHALSKLKHESIVQVYAYGVSQRSEPYMVLEFLEGTTLDKILHSEERLPWRRACRLIRQLCNALKYCHGLGLIHRDLKPPNIIILKQDNDEVLKLLDFGLVKGGFIDSQYGTLTESGQIIGSLSYLSPEAIDGKNLDHRTDIFSLGAILYECLSGERAFSKGNPIATIAQIKQENPKRFAKELAIPRNLELCVYKALQKDKESRFSSAEEFGSVLKAIEDDSTINVHLSQSLALGLSTETKKKPYNFLFYLLIAFFMASALIFYLVKPPYSSDDSHISRGVSEDERSQKLRTASELIATTGSMHRPLKVGLTYQRALLTLSEGKDKSQAPDPKLSLAELAVLEAAAKGLSSISLPEEKRMHTRLSRIVRHFKPSLSKEEVSRAHLACARILNSYDETLAASEQYLHASLVLEKTGTSELRRAVDNELDKHLAKLLAKSKSIPDESQVYLELCRALRANSENDSQRATSLLGKAKLLLDKAYSAGQADKCEPLLNISRVAIELNSLPLAKEVIEESLSIALKAKNQDLISAGKNAKFNLDKIKRGELDKSSPL